MITDESLYRVLMRTASAARRMPVGESENDRQNREEGDCGKPVRGRGFGHILDLLSEEEGLCQQQIAELAGIRPQSVSEAIGVLESRGLIRKESGIEDRRTFRIYLTETGECYRQKRGRERRLKAERLFSCLSEEEKERLYSILIKIQQTQKEKEENP